MPRLSGAPSPPPGASPPGPPPAPPPSRTVERGVQLLAGLQAALLLGRGDARGLAYAMLSPAGPARSFWAALFCLPAFLGIRLLNLDAVTPPRLTAELLGYAMGWVVFPLAVLPLAEASSRGALWPQLVAAWNWSNVAQYGVLLLALLVETVMPAPFSGALSLIAFGYAVWLEWFVARTALRVTGPRAALLVLLDLAIGLTIAIVVGRVGRG